MARRARVPKFGNWETEQNVPYTAYFDKARKGRSGAKITNPNDPRENPGMFPNDSATPPPKSKPDPIGPVGRTREESAVRQVSKSPARNNSAGRRAAATDPRYGVSSGTSSSYGSSHGALGRSRMKPSPEKSVAAVPKFGEWDEDNPASADGYTQMFNKVRKERQSGGGRVRDMTAPDPSYLNVRKKPVDNGGSKACCFPWGRE